MLHRTLNDFCPVPSTIYTLVSFKGSTIFALLRMEGFMKVAPICWYCLIQRQFPYQLSKQKQDHKCEQSLLHFHSFLGHVFIKSMNSLVGYYQCLAPVPRRRYFSSVFGSTRGHTGPLGPCIESIVPGVGDNTWERLVLLYTPCVKEGLLLPFHRFSF